MKKAKYPIIVTAEKTLKDGTYYAILKDKELPFYHVDSLVFTDKNPNVICEVRDGLISIFKLEKE